MEKWMEKLLKDVCRELGVERLLGQIVRFEVDKLNFENQQCKGGMCNRFVENGPIVHPRGEIVATNFSEILNNSSCIQLFIELKNTSGMGGLPYFVEYNGQEFTWNEYCGGFPAERHFTKHVGKLSLLTTGYYKMGSKAK